MSGGGAGVAACLCRGYPFNVQIDFSNVVATYLYVTRVSIMLHEILHAILVWHEQYQLGTFAATPGHRDFMNTGPESRHYFEYVEIERWKRTAYPPRLARAEVSFVWGALFYARPAANATRVAILIDRGQGWEWAGYYGPVSGSGCDATVCAAFLPQERGVLVAVVAENELSWKQNSDANIVVAGALP